MGIKIEKVISVCNVILLVISGAFSEYELNIKFNYYINENPGILQLTAYLTLIIWKLRAE